MREKYESLQLVQLKELAKARGLKGVSIMKKAALIELMLAEDEKEKAKAEGAKPAPAKEEAPKSAVPAKEEAPKAAAPAREEGARPAQNRTVVKVNQEFQRKPESRISFVRNESQSASRVEGGSNRYEASGNGNYTRNNNYGSNSGNYNNYKKNDNRTDNVVRENKTDMRTDNSETAEDRQQRPAYRPQEAYDESQYPKELDSGVEASGILEVMPDGYGFIRCENYMPGENDVYVAPSQIRRFGLKTGDILKGNKRIKTQQEKFSALLFVRSINGYTVEEASRRMNFEDMTPIFPNERINLETPGCSVAMRVMDLVSPVGKGQRGMIVSPPKAGKTTLLKEVAKSILRTNPHMHMLILLIDERPE